MKLRCYQGEPRTAFLTLSTWLAFFVSGLAAVDTTAQDTGAQLIEPPDTVSGDELVATYFLRETQYLTEDTAAKLRSVKHWNANRDLYRVQLQEMLGMDPMPQRTPLNANVVGTVERDDFLVERLHFQSMPGLYVTANLYRPKVQAGPLPAVLYVCGHGRSVTDGRSNGNKAFYQHHGAWFARNGYVCLTIDTVQLGEFPGIHHGTYSEKMWWWNNRGYTPAGVEAWNGIRALDYLETRPEVDKNRFAVTGRSGGGGYSWWIAALDQRIKAAVPVAGITSLHNHVVDGCVEGHCDCMFMVNTYRWDYPMVVALVSPRALLISNTDKDGIFPLNGVVDVHAKVAKLYAQQNASRKLGLHITEGPHKDTQELRVHAFRWMNRWLHDDESLIEDTATKFFDENKLRVFDKLPTDEIVTTAHEHFVPIADADLPTNADEFAVAKKQWTAALREKVFRGWPSPQRTPGLNVKRLRQRESKGIAIGHYEFASDSTYRLPFYVMQKSGDTINHVQVTVVDQASWDRLTGGVMDARRGATKTEDHALIDHSSGTANVFFPPRGVGPTQWTSDSRERTHIRRRFMQLGQTAATMQVWDVRRLLQSINKTDLFAQQDPSPQITLNGTAEMAAVAMHASLFESNISKLTLTNPPTTNRLAPDLLNISRFVRMPQLMMLAAERVDELNLKVPAEDREQWNQLAQNPAIRNKIQLDAGIDHL